MYRPIELTRANSERTEGIEVRRERVAQGGRGSDTRRGLLAAGLGLVVPLLSLASPALAQPDQPTPPLKWAARETYANNGTASDEAVDMVYWQEVNEACAVTGNHWVYTTGWVTETDPLTGAVIGTRFATYKYDAAHPGPDAPTPAVAYYPEEGEPILTGNTYKAVAMTVDPSNGDIYVVGQGPRSPTDNNLDFHVVRYSKNLVPLWSSIGVQYDGTAGGDDIPVDIRTNAQGCGAATYVIVAGTSPGLVEKTLVGNDIVLLALDAVTGERADDPGEGEWAANGPGGQPEPGVRRWDNPNVHGDDRAAEIGSIHLTSTTNSPGLCATVLGTTWNGPTLHDDIVFITWCGEDPSTSDNQAALFHHFRNDVGVGMSFVGSEHYAVGYSETQDPPALLGPGGGGSGYDIDITTLMFRPSVAAAVWNVRRDYFGDDDKPTDIDVTTEEGVQIWITGWTFNPSTIKSEMATLHYTHDQSNNPATFEWAEHLALGGTVVYGLRAFGVGDDFVYCTGAWEAQPRDAIFTVKYINSQPPPPALPSGVLDWYRSYTAGGFDEGRGVVGALVDGASGPWSIFVAGTSSKSTSGRDFVTLRYKE